MCAAPAIEVNDLRKSYGDHEVLTGVDLEVGVGELVAFLGPNGAGKTTTTEILEGFRDATSGSVSVLGQDPASGGPEWKNRLGIVLQECESPPVLTPRELLTQYAAYYQAPRPVSEVLDLVGLSEKADERIKKLSGGQKRRVDLALALIGDPELIFLDEPTTGFDPSARREAWDVIDDLRSLGRTIMLTTHYMDEAQRLADRIVVISTGQIRAEGTPAELARLVPAPARISWEGPDPAGLDRPWRRDGDEIIVEVDEELVVAAVQSVSGWALAADDPLLGLAVRRPGLEDAYLALIGADAAADQPVSSLEPSAAVEESGGAA